MTQETKTTLEAAFLLFTTKHDIMYREWMKSPFEYNGKVYATNGHALIRCDADKVDFKCSTADTGTTNPASVVPIPNISESVDLNSINWKSLMIADEIVWDESSDVECGYCKGDGTYYGKIKYKGKSYDVEYECPVCYGTGFEDTGELISTGNKTFCDTDTIKFKSAHFYAKNFYRLKQVSDLVKEPVELVSCNGKYSAHLFKCGFLDVLIMPCQVDFYDSHNTIFSID